MRIEIICTGDEVLTGKIVNTNFSYMAQKLEDFGLSVNWGTTVGDDREELLAAFQLSAERADAVIVNGGLGPTVDDLSQEIAARAAGVELVLNEDWLQRMEDFFRRRNRVMSENNKKQAMLPTTALGWQTRRMEPCGRTFFLIARSLLPAPHPQRSAGVRTPAAQRRDSHIPARWRGHWHGYTARTGATHAAPFARTFHA